MLFQTSGSILSDFPFVSVVSRLNLDSGNRSIPQMMSLYENCEEAMGGGGGGGIKQINKKTINISKNSAPICSRCFLDFVRGYVL